MIDNGNGKGKVRVYGSDSYPQTDYDFGHDHGAGDPHVHDWTRPDDGSAPTNQNRLPGRLIEPGEGPLIEQL